jgi:hypothetical protein
MSGCGVVAFDFGSFVATFPELASVSEPQACFAWAQAELILNNTPCSLVVNLGERGILLNLLTAHIVKLTATLNGQAPSGLVGRISNASEGSVSVAVDMPSNPSSAWFNQTPYGANYWQMSAKYRTMRYVAAPQRYLGVSRAGFGGRGW